MCSVFRSRIACASGRDCGAGQGKASSGKCASCPAGKTCDQWATRTQTFQVDGNKVFGGTTSTGSVAWRCVTNAHGTYVLSVSNGGKLPGVAFAIVVASGLDVSHRR